MWFGNFSFQHSRLSSTSSLALRFCSPTARNRYLFLIHAFPGGITFLPDKAVYEGIFLNKQVPFPTGILMSVNKILFSLLYLHNVFLSLQKYGFKYT